MNRKSLSAICIQLFLLLAISINTFPVSSVYQETVQDQLAASMQVHQPPKSVTLINGMEGNFEPTFFIDAAGTMYIAGITTSSDFPVTSNAYDKIYSGSCQYCSDGFFVKITSSGSFIYSTFLGGVDMDCIFKVLLDSKNDVYLFGVSRSNSCYPTTPNAYDPTCDDEDNHDYVITKMVNNGSYLLYSTYLGGSGDEPPTWQDRPHYTYPDFLLADENSVVIGGITTSTDYPVTNNALNKTLNGHSDACVSQLTFTGLQQTPTTTIPLETNFPSFIYLLSTIGVIITLHKKHKR